MPQQTLIKKNYSFVGGLNTDSGYLQQVPNSWKEGDNIIPFLDGHIERRSKIDLEVSYALSSTFNVLAKTSNAFVVDLWKTVGGNGLLNYAVVQSGATISFYDCVSPSVSPGIKGFTIDLTPYQCPTSPNVIGTSPIAMASGNGKLIIVSSDTDPLLVTYNESSDTITVTRLTLKIRDFYGIVDTVPITTNPTILTTTHQYNLINQGWGGNNAQLFWDATGTYPDDTQIWLQGKDSTDNFSPTLLNKQDFGTGEAPKGRVILDAFYRDRSAVSGVTAATAQSGTTPAVEVENYRPTTTAFFAGRAWYAGIQSSTMGSWVFFSRIADTDIKYEQCYQEGDPTAEYTNDLISSDGGAIPIPGAGRILLIKPLQESLLVFAQNGIWEIKGDASGFRADGYQSKQVSSFGVLSPKAVVDIETTIAFWASAGIYILEKDNVSGDYTPKSLSLGKIQTLYGDLQSTVDMAYVQGFYDSIKKIVYWMYRVQTAAGTNSGERRFEVENFLLYNVALDAPYTYSVKKDNGLAYIVGGFLSPNSGDVPSTDTVVAPSGTSVVVGVDTVIVDITIESQGPKIPKFLTMVPSGSNFALTFGDFLNTADTPTKFKDWYTVDNAGTETTTLPYILTGYDLEDDGAKNHQAPYIVTHMIKTETGFDTSFNAKNRSSCVLQGRWEWTDNSSASRWTSGEQIYRHKQLYVPASSNDTYADGYPLVVTKTKLRGKGKALQLKFSSAPGLEMKIAGWAISYAISTRV